MTARRVIDERRDDLERLAASGDTLATSRGSAPPVEPSPFDGSPMDPAAVAAEPLPTVPGFPFLLPGNAAVIVGPTGGGRSSLVQAGAYDAARAGVRVAYLGSEVTEPEFNARAADLAQRRDDPVTDELRERLAAVRYLDLASTIAHAWDHPDEWAREIPDRFDVVAMDPLSAVAATLDLDFDKSNADFVRFYTRLVQPLATAGTGVAMLDNVGHAQEAKGRAKGVSAKQDVADLTFWCKLIPRPLGLVITARKVRTVRAPFAHGDTWHFDRDTQRIEWHTADGADGASEWRPTVLMERASKVIEAEPALSLTALRKRIGGRAKYVDEAVAHLIEGEYVEPRTDGNATRHYHRAPFREADDA